MTCKLTGYSGFQLLSESLFSFWQVGYFLVNLHPDDVIFFIHVIYSATRFWSKTFLHTKTFLFLPKVLKFVSASTSALPGWPIHLTAVADQLWHKCVLVLVTHLCVFFNAVISFCLVNLWNADPKIVITFENKCWMYWFCF